MLRPLTARAVVSSRVLLSVCVLVGLSLLFVACKTPTGIETRYDERRGRSVRIDPRNQLTGTPQSKPTWGNPGVYFYDDDTRIFFIELKVRSNNVPLELKSGTLVIGGDRVKLEKCGPTRLEEEDLEGTQVFTEFKECRLTDEVFKIIAKAPEVRVVFQGKKSQRNALFDERNIKRFDGFYKKMTSEEK